MTIMTPRTALGQS